jgi:hypothetical protein
MHFLVLLFKFITLTSSFSDSYIFNSALIIFPCLLFLIIKRITTWTARA